MTRPPAWGCTNVWCHTGVWSTLLSQRGPLAKHKASLYQHHGTTPAFVHPQPTDCRGGTEKGGSLSCIPCPWIQIALEEREGESGLGWAPAWAVGGKEPVAHRLVRASKAPLDFCVGKRWELCPLLPSTLCTAHPKLPGTVQGVQCLQRC